MDRIQDLNSFGQIDAKLAARFHALGLDFSAADRQMLLVGTPESGRSTVAYHVAAMATLLNLNPIVVDRAGNRRLSDWAVRFRQRLPVQPVTLEIRAGRRAKLDVAPGLPVIIDGGRDESKWAGMARMAGVLVLCVSDEDDLERCRWLARRADVLPMGRTRVLVRTCRAMAPLPIPLASIAGLFKPVPVITAEIPRWPQMGDSLLAGYPVWRHPSVIDVPRRTVGDALAGLALDVLDRLGDGSGRLRNYARDWLWQRDGRPPDPLIPPRRLRAESEIAGIDDVSVTIHTGPVIRPDSRPVPVILDAGGGGGNHPSPGRGRAASVPDLSLRTCRVTLPLPACRLMNALQTRLGLPTQVAVIRAALETARRLWDEHRQRLDDVPLPTRTRRGIPRRACNVQLSEAHRHTWELISNIYFRGKLELHLAMHFALRTLAVEHGIALEIENHANIGNGPGR